MRHFKILHRLTDFNKQNIPIINRIIDYLNSYFRQRIQAQEVTYSTNMDTDVGGEQGDIVFCSTDSTFYGCSVAGSAGNATWVALN